MTQTQFAVWVSIKDRVLSQYPIHKPSAGEVQIKNVYVASNPKDFKSPIHFAPYEGIEGNDVAGYIESVGEGVTNFKEGDKVAAMTVLRGGEKYGAYQEYSISPAWTTFHLGPNTKLDEAATVPLAYMTAAIGLFSRLGLPTPTSPCTANPPTSILINGASTTVGIFAIQLAKLSNLHVIGIAGAGIEHAKSYGADIMIDYRNKTSSELSQAIEVVTQGKVHHVLDTISELGSYATISKALQSSGGGKMAVVLPQSFANGEIEYKNIELGRILVGKSHEEEKDFATEWFSHLGQWLEEGEIRCQNVTLIPGGLEGVGEGLRRLEALEVKSEKLVYRISDTPGIIARG